MTVRRFIVKSSDSFKACVVGEVLLPLQEAPAALAQNGIFALCFESPGLFGTDLVEGLAKALHEVKAVEHVHGRREPLADDGEVGFPDITADESNLVEKACRLFYAGRFLLALVLLLQFGKAVIQGLLRPLFAHPQQPAAVGVDLVQQGQKMMAFTRLDFGHDLSKSRLKMESLVPNQQF